MAENKLPVLNLNSILQASHKALVQGLEEVSAYADLSYRVQELLKAGTPLPLEGPAFLGFNPENVAIVKAQLVAGGYAEHSLRYAALASLILAEEFLLAPLLVMRIAKECSSGPVSLREVRTIQQKALRNSRNKHVWDLFCKEVEQAGTTFQNQSEFFSLRRMRNCLAHRRGIVSAQDLGEGTALSVKWLTPTFLFDGQEVDTFPFKIERNGGEAAIRIDQAVREYQEGDSISLSVGDCHGIIFTVELFCSDVLRQSTKLAADVLKSASKGR